MTGHPANLPASLAYLPQELATQDNAITADPIFLVEEEERVYGVSSDYTDSFEEPEEGDGDRVGYVVRWRFVQACFTRKAAERYIESNRHNLTEPRIYVASGHRNREWIAMREWLMSLAAAKRYVRLPKAVRGDFPFQDVVAPPGDYEADVNPQGAVSVRTADGRMLGVKPGEFQWVGSSGGSA